jgi:hypothetical protein
MTKAQTNLVGKAAVGLLVGGFAYAILSRRDCQDACQSVFQPLASEAGKLTASAILGLIITAL